MTSHGVLKFAKNPGSKFPLRLASWSQLQLYWIRRWAQWPMCIFVQLPQVCSRCVVGSWKSDFSARGTFKWLRILFHYLLATTYKGQCLVLQSLVQSILPCENRADASWGSEHIIFHSRTRVNTTVLPDDWIRTHTILNRSFINVTYSQLCHLPSS